MVKFAEMEPNMENVTLVLRIEYVSEFLTYKNKSDSKEKRYFHFNGFDGEHINKISVFDESMMDLIQIEESYKITGIKARINRYQEMEFTIARGKAEKVTEKITKKVITTDIKKIEDQKYVSVMAICTEVGEIKQFNDKTLRTVKLRDETGTIYCKSWNCHFPIEENEVVTLMQLRVNTYNGSKELIFIQHTSYIKPSKDESAVKLDEWYKETGINTSTKNVSLSSKIEKPSTSSGNTSLGIKRGLEEFLKNELKELKIKKKKILELLEQL